MLFCSRGAFVCARVLPKATVTKSHSKKEKSGAPGGAGVVGHATRTDVATRPRFGRGARHRRSACANRLLRARCASRRSTTIAVLRRGCRPPPPESRLSLLPPGSPAGVLSERIAVCNGKRDGMSRLCSYHQRREYVLDGSGIYSYSAEV